VDSQQARDILLAYRAGTSDANNPSVAQALDLARRDPELAHWLEEQNALYRSIRAKLKAGRAPDDLRERILASRKIVRVAFWRRNPVWLAAAAIFVLLIGAAMMLLNVRSASDFNSYRSEMVRFVAQGYKMDVEVESFAALQRVFKEKHWPFEYEVPKPLQAVPLEGGCAHTWRGHRVSLLCFETTDHKDIWLFVVERAAVPHPLATGSIAFDNVGGLPTAAWVMGSKLYLLTGEVDAETLKRLL
jgi:hypothetical protein